MSNYTKTFTIEEEFEGDKVVVELKRLTRTAMLQMLPALKTDKDGRVTMDVNELIAFCGAVADVAKPFILSVKGLVIEGEQACPKVAPALFDEIYESAMFTPLWGKVALSLLMESSVSKKDNGETEKKSDLPSNDSSEGAPATSILKSEESPDSAG